MSNNSDYKKARTNLYDLLPEVYKSDTNKSIFANVFDRYLSKDESETVYGSIGKTAVGGTADRRIQEQTNHRQAFQLQPLLHTKVATVNHLSSFEDLMREAEQIAATEIDEHFIQRMPKWGNATQFNFAPPIAFDKIVNYTDYFWFDEANPNSTPQYITMHNPCNTAKARLTQKIKELADVGDEFSILNSDALANEFVIFDNYSVVFPAGVQFTIYNSLQFDGVWTVESVRTEDGKTYIKVVESVDYTLNNAGIINFENVLADLQSDILCSCHGTSGWDNAGWDDNNCVIAVGDQDIECAGTWLSSVDIQDEIDTLTTLLTTLTPGSAEYIETEQSISNLEQIKLNYQISPPTGGELWDKSKTCEIEYNPWMTENHWVHRVDLDPGAASIARQATMPIIEYAHTVEMNEWTQTAHTWMYRPNPYTEWEVSDSDPSTNEMITLDYDGTSINSFVLNSSLGDVTHLFPAGSEFYVAGSGGTNDGKWTVANSQFTGNPAQTIIETVETPNWLPTTSGTIVPVGETSKGDDWLGFYIHWALIDTGTPVPINHQIENPLTKFVKHTVPEGAASFQSLFPLSYTNDQGVFVDYTNVALGGYDDIRVFVNGIQQYGTYEEILDGSNEYIVDINFFEPLGENTVVIIEVNAAALADAGRESAYVRTIINEDDFNTYGPELTSLIRYRQSKQTKELGENKYPLFDLFDIFGNTTNTVSKIFTFEESETAPVNNNISRRIVTSNSGREYNFEQFLIEEDNGKLFCYKDTATAEPSDNPTGLQSIWKKGFNDEEYIPRYVDENRLEDGEEYIDSEGAVQEAHVPYGGGSWEVPNQLYYNASHENRKVVKLSQLVAHFQSIVKGQELPFGFLRDQIYASRLLDQLNVGIGGTIKEHNDSYDLFLSALYIKNNNPIGVINFADAQYGNAINTIVGFFKNNIIEHMLNTDPYFIAQFNDKVADDVIQRYELNDAAERIFGDTTAYNATTDKGIKNWPVTVPIVKLGQKVTPVSLVDSKRGISEVIHHDGHISTLRMSAQEINSVTQQVISTVINDQGRKRGWTDTLPADGSTGGTAATRLTVDWDRLLPNDYWLEIDKSLYKFTAIDIAPVPPSSTYPVGTMYVRSTDGMLMVRDNTIAGWSPINGTPGDMTEAWEQVDLVASLMNLIVEAETRLYDVTEETDTVFDFDSLIQDTEDQTTYDYFYRQAFNEYVRIRNIEEPFATDFALTDPFTWNYSSVDVNDIYVHDAQGNSLTVENWDARYYTINEKQFGTAYPHLEPWKLQGYTGKPTWWGEEYEETNGTRRWVYDHATTTGMWQNIRHGEVPAGREYPDGSVSTGSSTADGQTLPHYEHFSVNISDNTTSDGYAPDDLMPTYWTPPTANVEDTDVEDMVFIRSNTSIPYGNIGDEYEFGDNGPVEWAWRKSSQYVYDKLKIAFKMQPVRFMHYAWGVDFVEVGGLQVETVSQKVYSHTDTTFHGELLDNEVYQVNGINQWYVNFNRFNNFDGKTSDFYTLWKDWDTQLSYQFDSMVDVRSMELTTGSFNITNEDFDIVVKKSPGFADFWIDALQISVSDFGTSQLRRGVKVPKGSASDWTFIIDAPIPITREIKYFPVRKHNFEVVDGPEGLCRTVGSTHFWQTGDTVRVSTTEYMPKPLTKFKEYNVVRIDANHFKLAESYTNATLLTPDGQSPSPLFIPLETDGSGTMVIEQIETEFVAHGGEFTSHEWKNRVVEKNRDVANTVTFPLSITGLQNVIDFVNGYSSYLEMLEDDKGFKFNVGSEQEEDPITGLPISWQTEKERFVNEVYKGFSTNNIQHRDRGYAYHYTINPSNDEINLPANSTSGWIVGQSVYISTSGTLPTPLMSETPYYIIPLENGNYKLAETHEDAIAGISIDIINSGTGVQFIGQFELSSHTPRPYVELNPFRNNLWFESDQGVMSNVITGPYGEVRVEQTIYDQYGRRLTDEHVNVFREDKLGQITVRQEIPNDVEKDLVFSVDPYNYLHIGGMHLYLDGFEHTLVFDHYSGDGFLIYDPFVGLNVGCFLLQFLRQEERTKRPNIGGYYLEEDRMIRNVEASVGDMLEYYDTYNVSESAEMLDHSRGLLGYEELDYLDHIDVGQKSKFLFWKSMIQHKGSINSVNAIINSDHFIDAKVDEFWSYKVGEFGDIHERSYPAMNLNINDTSSPDMKLFFTDDNAGHTYEAIDQTNNFKEVSIADENRWNKLPDLIQTIGDIPNFYFDAEVIAIQEVATAGTVVLDNPADHVVVLDVDKVNIVPTIINANVINLTGGTAPYKVYIYQPAVSKLNPSKIIDTKSRSVVSDLFTWDPARGFHNYLAISVVDIQRDEDPRYSSIISQEQNWLDDAVGTVWMNTSSVGYVPYYDENIFPIENEKINYWGRLADWASFELYEWTKSDVPPEEWATKVAETEGDNSLEFHERASGTAKQTIEMFDGVNWNRIPESDLHFDTYKELYTSSTFAPTDDVTLYVNGFKHTEDTMANIETVIATLNNEDHIHIIHNIVIDDVTYRYVYDYVEVQKTSSNSLEHTSEYYFWVRGSGVRSAKRKLSLKEAEVRLTSPSAPYQIFFNFAEENALSPHRYTKMVVRNVANVVDEESRYILRFTRDFSLRDTLETSANNMDLKNKHTQWRMFRQAQPYNVPLHLWTAATESLMGYQIDKLLEGTYVSVPSLDRVLYDERTGENTRYGLRDGQTFCDKVRGVAIVQDIINASDFDPYPVDKAYFLENYNFDSALNTYELMTYVYNNFPFEQVNRIFFALMEDAFSINLEYEDIFKTSMIALHGIRILETAGNASGDIC